MVVFRLYWGKLPLDVNFCTYYFVMWEKTGNKKGRGSTYVLSVLYTTNLRCGSLPSVARYPNWHYKDTKNGDMKQ